MDTKSQRGQSLVEIVVAVGLIFTAVVSLLALATSSMKSAGLGVTKVRATKLANKEMELIRAYRDSMDWTTFWYEITNYYSCWEGEGGNNCFVGFTDPTSSDLSLTLYGVIDTSSPPFTQYFNVIDVSEMPGGVSEENKLRVIVHVEWSDQSGNHDGGINSILADWE